MPVSEVLQSFRKGGYGPEKPGPEMPTDQPSARVIKLTDDEMKELQGYSQGPGAEQQCQVTGRLGENGDFTVSSVHSAAGGAPDEAGMAKEMMSKMQMPNAG